MASEFFINSQELEDKIRQLLPSQGGAGAGFDLSASTQIIPIIDLTESAEGSNLRQDLQSSFSHDVLTNTNISNATNTALIVNTGYYRVLANGRVDTNQGLMELNLFDGTTSKTLFKFNHDSFTTGQTQSIDIIVALEAGDSLRGTNASNSANSFLNVSTRQIATIDGVLVNPV